MDANPFLVADQKRREAAGTHSARDGAIARTRKRRSLTHTGSFHARKAAAAASAESGGSGAGGKVSFMSRIREESAHGGRTASNADSKGVGIDGGVAVAGPGPGGVAPSTRAASARVQRKKQQATKELLQRQASERRTGDTAPGESASGATNGGGSGRSTTQWRSLKFVPVAPEPVGGGAPLYTCWMMKRGRLKKKAKNRLFKVWGEEMVPNVGTGGTNGGLGSTGAGAGTSESATPAGGGGGGGGVMVYYKLDGGAACGVIQVDAIRYLRLEHGDSAPTLTSASPLSPASAKPASEEETVYELSVGCSDRVYALSTTKLAVAEGLLSALIQSSGGRLELCHVARTFGQIRGGAWELARAEQRAKAADKARADQASAAAEAEVHAAVRAAAQAPGHKRNKSKYGSAHDQTAHISGRALVDLDAVDEDAPAMADTETKSSTAQGRSPGKRQPAFERSLGRAQAAVRAAAMRLAELQIAAESLSGMLADGANDGDDLGVKDVLAKLTAGVSELQGGELKQLSYSVQLHKTAAALHIRRAMEEWNRAGWLRKPDWGPGGKIEEEAWELNRGLGRYTRWWCELAREVPSDALSDKEKRKIAKAKAKAKAKQHTADGDVAGAQDDDAETPEQPRWVLRWRKKPTSKKVSGRLVLSDIRLVRATAAPKAPPLSLDLVSAEPTRVFTMTPESKQERVWWSVALNEVVTGTSMAALGLTERLEAEEEQKRETKAMQDFKAAHAAPSSQGTRADTGEVAFTVCSHASGPAPPARDAAHEINAALERGHIVTFAFHGADHGQAEERYVYKTSDPSSMAQLVAAPQTNTAGGASGANDSANRVGLGGATGGNAPGSTGQLQLLRVAGGSAAPRTLRDEYDVFRRQFSVRSPPEQFRAALAKYMRGKEEKFLYEARLVLMRLQDAPDECVKPARFGDLLIVWSPRRDDADVTFADRSLANAVVVNNLVGWLEQNQCLMGMRYRCDAAHTEQGDEQPLDYRRIYFKLFQSRLRL